MKSTQLFNRNRRLNLLTTEDCLIKIAGKIVNFDLIQTFKDIEKETKGKSERSVLNRQKIVSDFLSYTMNIHVISSLTKWALKYQVEESENKSQKSMGDKIIDYLTGEKEKNQKIADYVDEKALSTTPVRMYDPHRKSLLLVLFKETAEDDEMTEEEKEEQKKKSKLDEPGTDKMTVGNYLENMLGTTHYTPIRYMYFPEVELSSYKEASTSEEKAEGDFIVVVKRPGNSEYPVVISDPVSDTFDILGGIAEDVWSSVSNIWGGAEGGSGGTKAK